MAAAAGEVMPLQGLGCLTGRIPNGLGEKGCAKGVEGSPAAWTWGRLAVG